MEVIACEAAHTCLEPRPGNPLVLSQQTCLKLVGSPRMPVTQCSVSKDVLGLGLLAECLSLSPYPCRAELGILDRAVTVCTENHEPEVLGKVESKLEMGIEVQTFLIILFLKKNLRMIDVCRGIVLHPVFICGVSGRAGRILCRSRVEHHLVIEEVTDLMR